MERIISILILILFSTSAFGQGKVSRTTPTSTRSSTKLSVSGTENRHDYVDLGLPSGTLWATTNIGANTPAEYGNYYAWAETKPKKTYTKENSKTFNLSRFADGLGNIKSDTVRAIVRIIDNPQYDAASVNWGDGWELPSAADFTELNRDCKWDLKTIDGHKGYLITGPNGNTLFLPMAGYVDNTYKSQVGSSGFYWTGDFWDDKERSTSFNFTGTSHSGTIWSYRHTGKSIRPVRSNRKSSFQWSTNQ